MPFIIVYIIIAIVQIVAWWRIFRRVGWAPWVALLWIIPVVGLVILFVFAFSRWPIEERMTSREDRPLRGGDEFGTSGSVRYCSSCGGENDGGSRFCRSCGNQL